MVRRVSEDDDWHKVLNPRKRKQIQDRLAQRARSKYFNQYWKQGLMIQGNVLQMQGSERDTPLP
jgi:hypothetical protein